MGAAIYLPMAVSLFLALMGPRLSRWLPPSTAVRLLTVTALATALATGFVLAVAGFVALAQLAPVAAMGHWSVLSLRSGDSVPAPVGAVAGAAVVVLLVAAARRLWKSARELVAVVSLSRSLPATEGGLVVLDDDRPEAFALPGLRGKIVVSTAMLSALPADERRVLLAHEAAHLTYHHHIYLQAIDLAASANPLLRPTAIALHAATERWADEVAASRVGDRHLAARALARAALARAASTSNDRRLLPIAAGLQMAGSGVPERARALLAPAPPARRLLAVAVTMLILIAAAAAAETGRDTETGFEHARSSFETAQ